MKTLGDLRQKAEQVVALAAVMNDAIEDKEEALVLAIMAGLKDAFHEGWEDARSGRCLGENTSD